MRIALAAVHSQLWVARPKVRRRAWRKLCGTGVPQVDCRMFAADVPPVRCGESLGASALAARQWHARPRAVTLMELLLVLVLLVIAGSLVIPAITGAFGGVRLRRSGDAVIARWAEARAQAIETGAAFQFRFEPDTGRYRLEPLSSVEPGGAGATTAAATGRSSTTTQQLTAAEDATDSSTEDEPETSANRKTLAESPTIQSVLPEPILFVSGQTAAEDAVRRERRVDALETHDSAWSTPILFFPDGTTSTATLVLRNDVPQFLRITLRGLTGVARASALLTREEYDEGAQTR